MESENNLQKEVSHNQQAENYEEIKKIYEETGTTFEEKIMEDKEMHRKTYTRDKLYQSKHDEYKHGNYSVNGKDCADYSEYWNTFLTEIVQEQMKTYDFSEFDEELQKAEQFYYDNKAAVML